MPQRSRDRATFEKPMEPSVGVRYLAVGGTLLVDEGKLVPDVFPGKSDSGAGQGRASSVDGAFPLAGKNSE